MDKFLEMKAFVAVVDHASFVRAAEATNSSKAAVSRLVAELERRLNVRLLNRTTRKLSLTDDGKVFYARCTDLLNTLAEAESEMLTRTGEASGHLHVTAPVTFGNNLLAPLWGAFLAQHPKVSLDVALSDRTADLVEEGLDLAVRISRAPHPAFVARRLATTQMVVCASPQYLREHGTPQCPADIAQHDVVAYSYWSSRDEWEFTGDDGAVETVKTRTRLQANSGDTCVAAALGHHGIIMQPDFLLYQALRAGTLVRLLPDYRAVELGIYAVYASRRQLPLKLRYLIDFLVESFQTPVWQDSTAV
jgi:DNA-binding transcriptional LysR family regulator